MATPTKYTEELAAQICERIANGELMTTICAEIGVSTSSIHRWLEQSAAFRETYARAKDQRVDHWGEDIVRLADDHTIDPNSRRLQVDTRKWLMSKLKPKTYGDKLQHTGSDGDGPIQIKVSDDWARPVIEGARVVAITDLNSPDELPSDT